jgi:hypothetical protein
MAAHRELGTNLDDMDRRVHYTGAGPALLFAASHPERTRALVLYAPVVRTLEAPGFPWGWTEER